MVAKFVHEKTPAESRLFGLKIDRGIVRLQGF